ncbi:MAG TPA: hypothetical protein VFZ16_12485, partial [Hyphomicrobiaceae bacterium]|nr:hypothetical protein [Hyphomicrobiaceae bacterium]
MAKVLALHRASVPRLSRPKFLAFRAVPQTQVTQLIQKISVFQLLDVGSCTHDSQSDSRLICKV